MLRTSFPQWLHTLSLVWLALGLGSAIFIILDEMRRPQSMRIMNFVWPLCALFGTLAWVWIYLQSVRRDKQEHERHRKASKAPSALSVFKACSHCGGGCTLADILVEWMMFAVPSLAVWFGWHSLFTEKTFAVWTADFILAFTIGISFQFFTIKPMTSLSTAQALRRAIKIDLASIVAWQIGMYGIMALIQFAWFQPTYGRIAPVNSPEFWFAMQMAMLGGVATSFPVNWWLLRSGKKMSM